MFRPATPSDLPGITALWQEAFGDSPDAVSDFFRAFPGCLSFVAEEDGSIVSMVHALPQTLWPDTKAAYLYAVATLHRHRGRGLCRALMAFAEEKLAAQGFACCVLSPGEPELFGYYARLGYAAAFSRQRTAFPGGTPIAPAAYLQRRAQLLEEPHMVCDGAVLSYAARLYDLTFYETADGIAAAGPRYTAEVLPADARGAGAACGMIKWLAEPRTLNGAYLGFALE